MSSSKFKIVDFSMRLIPIGMMISVSIFAAPGGQAPQGQVDAQSDSVNQGPRLSLEERQFINVIKAVLANLRAENHTIDYNSHWLEGRPMPDKWGNQVQESRIFEINMRGIYQGHAFASGAITTEWVKKATDALAGKGNRRALESLAHDEFEASVRQVLSAQ